MRSFSGIATENGAGPAGGDGASPRRKNLDGLFFSPWKI
jgi:hypothetical protein